MRKVGAENRIFTLWDFAVCFFLAIRFSASSFYIETGYCAFTWSFAALTAMHFCFFLLLDYAGKRLLYRYARREDRGLPGRGLSGKYGALLEGPRGLLFTWAVLFLCWLPTLVVLYPGTLINDTWGQLSFYNRFLEGHPLQDNSPALLTLIYGFVLNGLQRATGSWHAAFFIFVICQGMLTSLAFASAVSYAYRKLRIGAGAAFGMLLIYGLLPVFPASVQTIAKDAFSAWIFVFFTLIFLEIARTRGEALKERRTLISLTLTGLFCALTRKVNIPVILFSVICLPLVYPAFRKRMILPIAIIGGITVVGFQVMYHTGILGQAGKQELLPIPYQQTARFVKEHPEEVTEEEYDLLDRVLGMEDLAKRYSPVSADPVKGYGERATTTEYIGYAKTWVAQGLRHPLTYVEAFDAMLSGWFSWHEYIPLMDMTDWHSQLDRSLIPEEAAERTWSAEAAKTYQTAYEDLYRSPIARFFLSYGFFAAILPAFIFCVLMRKKTKEKTRLWAAMIPLLLSLLFGCFLAPVSISMEGRRYLYQIIYTEPVLLAFCIHQARMDPGREAAPCGE